MRSNLCILALLLLAGAYWTQPSNPSGPSSLPLVDSSSIFVSNWMGLITVALALSVAMIAITFMFGMAFNLNNVKSFARQEVYELVVSVLILVLILSGLYAYGEFAKNVSGSSLTPGAPVVSGFCNDSVSLYPQTSANPENRLFADVDWFLGCMPTGAQGKYDNLTAYNTPVYSATAVSPYAATDWGNTGSNAFLGGPSKGILAGHLMNIYISLFTLEFLLGPISTFGVSAYLPEPLISSISLDFAPHAALSPISEVTITVTDLIGVGVGTIIMQKLLLQFIHENALAVFLPLGLGFRAIPFLRKTGSTIIALAIVMYFVFPLSIWINQQVYFNLQGGILPNGQYEHPVISDWSNYHTLLQACTPTPGTAEMTNLNLVTKRASETIAAPYIANATEVERVLRQNVYKTTTSNGKTTSVYLPNNQLNALLRSLFVDNALVVGKYLLHPGFAVGPSIPVDFFYTVLVDQITVSAQWFVLNLLFLVNTLIITITLFRDISLAIGGEPRIFGMGKLV